MEVLMILVVGTLNVVCFLIGAKVGQMTSKGEEIKMPTINPMTIYREHQDHKESEKKQKQLDAILHNIECYDGTDRGQEDIPRW
jgi:hypothetical protein